MQSITILILRLLYIFLSIYIGIPGININNIYQIKLFLFFGIFFFTIIVNLSLNKKSKCKKKIKNNLYDAIIKGVLAVLSYSLYVDFIHMDSSKNILKSVYSSKMLITTIISFTIVIFMFLFELLLSLFSDKC